MSYDSRHTTSQKRPYERDERINALPPYRRSMAYRLPWGFEPAAAQAHYERYLARVASARRCTFHPTSLPGGLEPDVPCTRHAAPVQLLAACTRARLQHRRTPPRSAQAAWSSTVVLRPWSTPTQQTTPGPTPPLPACCLLSGARPASMSRRQLRLWVDVSELAVIDGLEELMSLVSCAVKSIQVKSSQFKSSQVKSSQV